MTTFTRLTVVGQARRAEIVAPDDETLDSLLPEILDLIDEGTVFGGSALTLVRRTGEELDLQASIADLQVPDGDVLRIVRQEEAPPPPEVADVTDVVAAALPDRRDRWGDTSRMLVAAAAIAVVVALLGFRGSDTIQDPRPLLIAGYVGGLLLALLFGRLGQRWWRVATTALSLGAAAPLGWDLVLGSGQPPLPHALIVAVVLAWLALGVGWGVATRTWSVLWGALTALLLGAAVLLLAAAGVEPILSAAAIAIASTVTIGVLPGVALSLSGLTRLDDAAIRGELPARKEVSHTLDQTYATMAWLAAALAIAAGAGAASLIRSENVFAAPLGLALGLVLALRTRQLPLWSIAASVWAAVLVVFLSATTAPLLSGGQQWLLLAAIPIVAALLAGIRPPRHVRVRLRRLGNALELIAVVAIVPLLLGLLEVYPALLETFG